MDAPQRGALMLIRLVAVALMGLTVLELSFYVLDARFHNHPIAIVPCVLWAIPFVAGVIALAKAKALANWISDMLE